MATWGDFIAEVTVIRPSKTEGLKSNAMYVAVDQVIGIWEERNNLRSDVSKLKQQLTAEREACAQEVDDLAQACEDEGTEQSQYIAQALRAAAGLIRERAAMPEAGELPVAEPVDPALASTSDAPMANPIEPETGQTL
jgi:hypothetical protein